MVEEYFPYDVEIGSDLFRVSSLDAGRARAAGAILFRDKYNLKLAYIHIYPYITVKKVTRPRITTEEVLEFLSYGIHFNPVDRLN
jgi:hypothetical protein